MSTAMLGLLITSPQNLEFEDDDSEGTGRVNWEVMTDE